MSGVSSARLKIWQGLSELFLDTEVDDDTFDRVARTISDSGYAPAQAHSILGTRSSRHFKAT